MTPPAKVPKCPKGWRELKRGEQILATDKFWIWGRGPWIRQGDASGTSIGQFYRPTLSGVATGEDTHWMNVRRLAKKKGKGKT